MMKDEDTEHWKVIFSHSENNIRKISKKIANVSEQENESRATNIDRSKDKQKHELSKIARSKTHRKIDYLKYTDFFKNKKNHKKFNFYLQEMQKKFCCAAIIQFLLKKISVLCKCF